MNLPPRLSALLTERRIAAKVDALCAGMIMIALGMVNVVEPARIMGYLYREFGITLEAMVTMLVGFGVLIILLGISVLRHHDRPRVWINVLIIAFNAPLIFIAIESIPAVLEHAIPLAGFLSYVIICGLTLRLCRSSFQTVLLVWFFMSASDE